MIDPQKFIQKIEGKDTRLIYLNNSKNLHVVFTNYGARILELVFRGVNVTPAYPSLADYQSATIAPYHGATVGRYANRIAAGRFTLEGKQYQLAINNAPNHLHGGPTGFHTRVWEVKDQTENEVSFTYLSPHGEEGYPGNVAVTVTYTLTEADEISISYVATTDSATPFNITNHAFFNLNGEGTVLEHDLLINADAYTPVDETLIPFGEPAPVAETAFDFRNSKKIGTHINNKEEQVRLGGGYDHNFVLNKNEADLSFAAKAVGDKTGIVMEVYTEEPGLQLFSGNFEIEKGNPATFRNSFCLETQHFPDSPNRPDFPSAVLKPGQTFRSKTVYRFL